MRLVYVHKSLHASLAEGLKWNPTIETKNTLMTNDFATDGYVAFFEELIKRGIVDEVLVVIESRIRPGHCKLGKLDCLVMPNLKFLWKHLDLKKDVLFMRGGYKWWIPFLDQANAKGIWVMFYAAGTRRNFWPHWDIVLYEFMKMAAGPKNLRGKLYVPFIKPINYEIFKPQKVERVYDLCLGASTIYDVKSQWVFAQAMREYEKIYGVRLQGILPGPIRRGVETEKMINMAKKGVINLKVTNRVPRERVAKILNQSKIFCHQCTGQNDRGALEAMVCGVPMLTLNDSGTCYPRWMPDKEIFRVVRTRHDFAKVAEDIHDWLNLHTEERRQLVAEKAAAGNNMEITYKHLAMVFDAIKSIGIKADRRKLIEVFQR